MWHTCLTTTLEWKEVESENTCWLRLRRECNPRLNPPVPERVMSKLVQRILYIYICINICIMPPQKTEYATEQQNLPWGNPVGFFGNLVEMKQNFETKTGTYQRARSPRRANCVSQRMCQKTTFNWVNVRLYWLHSAIRGLGSIPSSR